MQKVIVAAWPQRAMIGLTLLVGPMSFLAQAQDYIDVEAERRAAEAAQPPITGTPAPSGSGYDLGNTQGTSGAVSYGLGDAPSGAATTRMLPPPEAPARDNIGGLFNQVQQLQQEVMRLNGIVEQQAYELRTLKEQSLERYMDIDRRLTMGVVPADGVVSAPDGGSASTPTGGSGGGGGLSTGGTPGAAVDQVQELPGEGEAYRAAYALVRGQEFNEAVEAFQIFLQNFPDGRYAPNAHYWLGELFLVVEPADPEASRQSFMLLLSQYPDHAKVPDALFKLGRVHFIKGNSDRAREYLNRVIREYPQSGAARLAGDFLDQNL